jgi:signal transduction histidine kinase
MLQLAPGARISGFENALRTRDGGERSLSWSAVRDGDRFYCVGHDVTAAKQAARALAETEEQLRQALKMEAVGQLTGGLAHDFNNILAVISGSIELLQRHLQDGDVARIDRYATSALTACNRGAALTHRLLAFARRQTLDPTLVSLTELVLGMETMLQRAVGPGVSITTDLPASTGMTQCDPNQLENAILNLAINARDAMPDGGQLSITTANLQLDEANAALRGMAPGRYVTLSVSDTGTGMPASVLARAFDPFFTTKPPGKGTGLGLSMIYGFAKQSGGAVTIQSKEGAGTTVSLLLPRAAAAALPPAATRRKTSQRSSDLKAREGKSLGQTVLLVDDEPELRFVLARMITRIGYTTMEAADGPSALRHLAAPGQIDLMVTDVGLPGGMNGRQLADAARALRPGLKVLFITGLTDPQVLDGVTPEQGMDVMSKPFDMDGLAAKIGDLIGLERAA